MAWWPQQSPWSRSLPLITNVACGDDVVTRLSLQSVHDLLLVLEKMSAVTAFTTGVSKIFSGLKKAASSPTAGQRVAEATAASAEAAALPAGVVPPEANPSTASSSASYISAFAATHTVSSQELMAAGAVAHLTHPVSGTSGSCTNLETRYSAQRAFAAIPISKHWLKDHKMEGCECCKSCARAAPVGAT
jgi:hypothetical protein